MTGRKNEKTTPEEAPMYQLVIKLYAYSLKTVMTTNFGTLLPPTHTHTHTRTTCHNMKPVSVINPSFSRICYVYRLQRKRPFKGKTYLLPHNDNGVINFESINKKPLNINNKQE
jgi:hypothetical protein